MTFSVGTDATAHDSQSICTGASTEEAALAALLLCYLVVLPYPVQADLDGVRVWATNSVMPKIPASLLDNWERLPREGDVAEVDTSIHTSSEAPADADTMYKASEGIQRVVSGEYCQPLMAILDAADSELRAT
ncbi:hypothetical protein ON010_g17754 [Phytophthora cinnamomi]|nr:hypothetical protein ON010_g17754 [Phytophthora cinnamomi]